MFKSLYAFFFWNTCLYPCYASQFHSLIPRWSRQQLAITGRYIYMCLLYVVFLLWSISCNQIDMVPWLSCIHYHRQPDWTGTTRRRTWRRRHSAASASSPSSAGRTFWPSSSASRYLLAEETNTCAMHCSQLSIPLTNVIPCQINWLRKKFIL